MVKRIREALLVRNMRTPPIDFPSITVNILIEFFVDRKGNGGGAGKPLSYDTLAQNRAAIRNMFKDYNHGRHWNMLQESEEIADAIKGKRLQTFLTTVSTYSENSESCDPCCAAP